MLECVVNISEGRDRSVLRLLADAAGDDLLDLHVDPFHHRSVFTLLGTQAVRHLTRAAVSRLDLGRHQGVHPRLGVVDVVPFVPLAASTMVEALDARQEFAGWAARELAVPCFLYGPERTLPEVRRRAWNNLAPDLGSPHPHPSAGAICVGARGELVAYNVYLSTPDLAAARRVAAAVRGPHLRALGLQVGGSVQVSMNLIEPHLLGPADAFELVRRHADVTSAELVGLLSESVLRDIAPGRWNELDVGLDRTIEWRLSQPPDVRRRAWADRID